MIYTIVKMKFILKNIAGFVVGSFVLASFVIFVLSKPALAPETESGKTNKNIDSANERIFPTNGNALINDQAIQAKSYIVYDKDTGKVLASRASDTSLPIASITKLMTGYLVHVYGSLDDSVTVQPKNELSVSPTLGVIRGDSIQIEDLFKSMIIGSANDAALTLGSYIETKTGKKIDEAMNEEAEKLGMVNTRFNNALGFDSETNYSTADDIRLLLAAIHKYPVFELIDRELSYSFTSNTGRSYSVRATNKLLSRDPEIHAVKTGFTNEAQGAMITSIVHKNGKFIVIVLGSQNRESDTILLKNRIIKTFYTATQPL
ncbi:MAG: serine hydrolase [bacterium]|nr:serine hydrolase [bacterium]